MKMTELETTNKSIVSESSMGARYKTPIAIDVFSGAGGLSQGFIDAGFHVAASIDSDKWAVLTQKENHCGLKNPTEVIECSIEDVSVQKLLDICKKNGVSRPDVLMGGPPCQGFSRSNMRTRTMENPNNCLFRKFLCLAKELKPRVVLIENVADFAKFEDGAIAEEIKRSLADMPVRYKLDFKVLCAADYGVPQYRNRVFFVAFEEDLNFEFPDKFTEKTISLWDAISDLPELSNGNNEDTADYSSESKTEYQKLMRNNGKNTVHNNLISKNGELVLKRYKHIGQGQNWESIPDDLMSNYTDKTRTHHSIYLRLKQDKPSVTITHFRKSMLIHPTQDRGLSVREAARIQSFKDSFRFLGPLTHQQQQVANAVPPLLAEAVASSVRLALGIKDED